MIKQSTLDLIVDMNDAELADHYGVYGKRMAKAYKRMSSPTVGTAEQQMLQKRVEFLRELHQALFAEICKRG